MIDQLFTIQTKGIKRRYRSFRRNWKSHLETTKEIVNNHIAPQLASGRTLTILGAGQLLDFPKDLLYRYQDRITLVDRSSLALKSFSKKTALYDITGTLETWCRYLSNLKASKPAELLTAIGSIHTTIPLLPDPCFRDEVLLSLNILSQLPVYWQDAVFDIFNEKFSKKLTIDWEEKILNALLPSFSALIKSHLKALIPKGPHKQSILITDTHYLSYHLESNIQFTEFRPMLKPSFENLQTPDIESTTNLTPIKIESMDALFGVSIENELSSKCNIQKLNKWLWDITPFGQDISHMGTKHRVIAICLAKS